VSAIPETFVCVPQSGARLTRWACAQRHQRALRPGVAAVERLHGAEACRSCSVGAAHLRGETPDVTIASIVARVGEKRIEMRQEGQMANERKSYTWQGETLTTAELAVLPEVKRLGLSEAIIVGRLRKDWTLEDVLTTPPGKGQRRMSQREAPVAPKASAKRARQVVAARVEENAERKQLAKLAKLPKLAKLTKLPDPVDGVTIADEVREIVRRLSPSELLRAAGFELVDVAQVPAGQMLIVRSEAA